MAIKLVYAPGATPLSPDELEGLLPDHIKTQAELDAWEQENIIKGLQTLATRGPGDILTDRAIKSVHTRMFGETWEWAGKYRSSGKTIGVDWPEIPGRVRVLCDDVRYQLENGTYPLDEIATRFHHRLVQIHPFPNGNGRCTRQVADMLLESQASKPFTWGSVNLATASATRTKYIDALRSADKGDYRPLLDFVRT